VGRRHRRRLDRRRLQPRPGPQPGGARHLERGARRGRAAFRHRHVELDRGARRAGRRLGRLPLGRLGRRPCGRGLRGARRLPARQAHARHPARRRAARHHGGHRAAGRRDPRRPRPEAPAGAPGRGHAVRRRRHHGAPHPALRPGGRDPAPLRRGGARRLSQLRRLGDGASGGARRRDGVRQGQSDRGARRPADPPSHRPACRRQTVGQLRPRARPQHGLHHGPRRRDGAGERHQRRARRGSRGRKPHRAAAHRRAVRRGSPAAVHDEIEARLKQLADGVSLLTDIHDVRARKTEHGLFVTFHCHVAGPRRWRRCTTPSTPWKSALKQHMPEVRRVIAHAEPHNAGQVRRVIAHAEPPLKAARPSGMRSNRKLSTARAAGGRCSRARCAGGCARWRGF
jgi:hypothetical protein